MIPTLERCPMCGLPGVYHCGGHMSDGTQLVKARCPIGCVEQVIYRMSEAEAAIGWNDRQGKCHEHG